MHRNFAISVCSFVVAAMIAVSTAPSASALTINLDLGAPIVWDAGFSALDPGTDVIGSSPGFAVGLQFDVFVDHSSLSAGESAFGGVQFDVTLGAGVTDAFNWVASFDKFAAGPPGPAGDLDVWETNADFGGGAAATDLQDIIGLVQGGIFAGDPRFDNFAADGSTYIGSLYLNWDGIGSSSVGLTVDSAIVLDGNDGNLLLNVTGTATTSGDSVALGETEVVPEPATFVLAGMGLVGLICGRRRS